LARTAMAYFRSNVYFFVNHSQITAVDGHKQAATQDGYHAELFCLSPDCSQPLVVPLKFDLGQGPLPVEELYRDPWNAYQDTGPARPADQSANWLLFSGQYLSIGETHTRGAWLIPTAEIETAVTAQKQILLAKMSDARALAANTMAQTQKSLLVKYDVDHNGRIDPDEREAALDDAAFIESELDLIDTNHNGWLEADELGYFDANQNKILEPKEQSGIEIAQHLLAERLFKKADADNDGKLDQIEFNAVIPASPKTAYRPWPSMPTFPDANHDGFLDLGEFESFLKAQTHRDLRVRGKHAAMIFNQANASGNQSFDARNIFKLSVEAYWQNPQ
jgi:Ca2+-binding EF-hand superfamily protein